MSNDAERKGGLHWVFEKDSWEPGMWTEENQIWLLLGTDEWVPTHFLETVGDPIHIPEKYRD